MQPLNVKQMLKKYKYAKVYLFKGRFVVVDPNTYYYCRVKGNHSLRCPENASIYDMEGNLFIGNYKDKQHAEDVAKGWNAMGEEKFKVGPIAPYVNKIERMKFRELDDIYPNGAGIYQIMDYSQEN